MNRSGKRPGEGYTIRREQYLEKKEVLRAVLSPRVTRTPFLPSDLTTARVFLQCPSVTKALDMFSYVGSGAFFFFPKILQSRMLSS